MFHFYIRFIYNNCNECHATQKLLHGEKGNEAWKCSFCWCWTVCLYHLHLCGDVSEVN